MKYFIRWKKYGAKHDKWLKQKEFSNAKELLRDYYKITFSAPTVTPVLRLFGTAKVNTELTRRR